MVLDFVISSRRLAAAAVAYGIASAGATAQQSENGAPHLTHLGIPAAVTLPAGSGFAQATYTNDRNGTGILGPDGSTAFGLGFGDLRSGFGAHAIVELTSFKDGFGDSGFLSVQGATRIRRFEAPVFAALSLDRLVAWGDATADDPSASLILSAFPGAGTGGVPVMLTGGLRLERAVAATGGAIPPPPVGGGEGPVLCEAEECDADVVGGPPFAGRTLAANAVATGARVSLGDYEIGVFGGIGVGLSDQLAASAAWNVDHAVLGVSYRPRQARNLSVSLSLVDPFEQIGEPRVALSVSYLFGAGL